VVWIISHSGTATQRRAVAVLPCRTRKTTADEIDVPPFEAVKFANAQARLLEHAQRQAPALRHLCEDRFHPLPARRLDHGSFDSRQPAFDDGQGRRSRDRQVVSQTQRRA
jgi:hypothetical protein